MRAGYRTSLARLRGGPFLSLDNGSFHVQWGEVALVVVEVYIHDTIIILNM